ncbi:urease subunit beta [Snodgrassella communis]|uniref:Urease subunit beta n=1 Tax=Snodgrassella communis TaxID=2946699 RepID=A0A836Z501_9NEIS|nr:urease subunit beta [Snodgrassella communis]KDN13854.1 Urease beta subunit [Snodgrassella communis]PIT11215.1 urease subunit beta [Snodgrassella communis]PIT27028.1 urease subunit beta [Snodgrassella communis]PIT30065.1 urease subunit beta [Snodgrassella communis]PIT34933.1 urease subunit beta [Snodgrassella communis]
MIPGEYILAADDIIANQNRRTLTITVVNRGDRPIQVGSHYHFYETNAALEFEREHTRGMRLNIPSGNAVWFEPGEAKTVALTEYGGHKKVFGFHNAVNGSVSNK